MMWNFLLSRVGPFSESVQSAPDWWYIFFAFHKSPEIYFFCISDKIFYLFLLRAALYSVNILSFFSRSRSDMAWMIFLFNQGGSLECFTRLWRTGASLLTASINNLYHTARASLGSMCWCTPSKGLQIRPAKNEFWLKCLKDLRKFVYVLWILVLAVWQSWCSW